MPELPTHRLMHRAFAQQKAPGLGCQVRDQPDGPLDPTRVGSARRQQSQGRGEGSGACLRVEIARQACQVKHADEVGEHGSGVGSAQGSDDLGAICTFPVFEDEPVHPGSHADQIDEAVDRLDTLLGLLGGHEDIAAVPGQAHRVASALDRAEPDDGDRFDSVDDGLPATLG